MSGEIKIRAIAKRPDSGWYVTNVANNLPNLQKWVGGYIETVTLFHDLVIVCNEEGLLQGLPYNCTICGLKFVGDILELKDWKKLINWQEH
ncbi:MAG: DUF3846 domain-containing protein [Lachnospiraceae bacterium]|nr:DUF3846 domain-containing protein [Lachnospiraceae bacterium]